MKMPVTRKHIRKGSVPLRARQTTAPRSIAPGRCRVCRRRRRARPPGSLRRSSRECVPAFPRTQAILSRERREIVTAERAFGRTLRVCAEAVRCHDSHPHNMEPQYPILFVEGPNRTVDRNFRVGQPSCPHWAAVEPSSRDRRRRLSNRHSHDQRRVGGDRHSLALPAISTLFNACSIHRSPNLWRPRFSAWRRTFLESGDEHIVGFDKADPCIY